MFSLHIPGVCICKRACVCACECCMGLSLITINNASLNHSGFQQRVAQFWGWLFHYCSPCPWLPNVKYDVCCLDVSRSYGVGRCVFRPICYASCYVPNYYYSFNENNKKKNFRTVVKIL